MATSTATSVQTGHVGLNVTDLERSVQFYAEALGLRVSSESRQAGRRFAFLGDHERLVLTLWEQADGRFEPARPGLHHLSFQVATLDDVRAAEARLRALGAPIYHDGAVAHGPGADSGGIFFDDPDGTRLEIYAPTGLADAPAPASDGPTCGFF